MGRLRCLVLTLIAAALLVGSGVGDPAAKADAPSAGDSCTVWHATTQDANGRTMWCNPTVTGDHNLVWQ